MGTSVDAVLAEKLKRDIRIACKSLEEIGYDSLVIVNSQNDQTQMGSENGIDFIDSFDLVDEFHCYCEERPHKSDFKMPQTDETESSSEQVDSSAVSDYDISEVKFPVFEPKDFEELHVYSGDNLADVGLETDVKPSDLDGNDDTDGDNEMELMDIKHEESPGPDIFKEESMPESVIPVRNQKKGKNKSPFLCTQCGKIFARAENLTIHLRSHSGEKPYSCETCGKSFVSKGQLNNHEATHSDRTPYSCKVCGMLFKRADYLWRHKALHSETYRYTCDVCGRGYDDASCLKVHKRRHTGEKPHSCEVCGKSFLMARVLRSHMLTHTGEKPYPCEVCGNSFREKKNLADHVRRKHPQDTIVSYIITSPSGESIALPESSIENVEIHLPS